MNIEHSLKVVYRNKKKNFLLAFQFCFSFLIIFLLYNTLLKTYIEYYSSKNLIKPDRLTITIDFKNEDFKESKNKIKQVLNQHPSISNFTLCSQNAPFSEYQVLNIAEHNQHFENIEVISTSSNYFSILGLELTRGDLFLEDRIKNDIIITEDLSTSWFKDKEPVGNYVFLGTGEQKQKLRVIGVVKNYKHFNDYKILRKAIIKPIKKEDYINEIIIKPKESSVGKNFENDIKSKISNINKNWEVSVNDFVAKSNFQNKSILIPLVIASLIVFFLIINTMLGMSGMLILNLKKRYKELGIRRAIGARKKQIFWHLTFEVLVVNTIVSVFGVLFVLIFPLKNVLGVTQIVYNISILITVLTLYIITFFTSIIPSFKINRINIIDALR